jgi:hypothetical protein
VMASVGVCSSGWLLLFDDATGNLFRIPRQPFTTFALEHCRWPVARVGGGGLC